jgi:hypothetical protein
MYLTDGAVTSKVKWSVVRPLSERVSTTVRSPLATVFETTFTLSARRLPACWSPSFCSKTVPLPATMIALGLSFMTWAPSPTPNQTVEGPLMVSVAVSEPESRSTAKLVSDFMLPWTRGLPELAPHTALLACVFQLTV